MNSLESLKEQLKKEVPKHSRLKSVATSPAIIAAIVALVTEVLPRLLDRCNRENPVEKMAEALNSKDDTVRFRTERILFVNFYRELRDGNDYEKLRSQKWSGSVPVICVDSLRKIAQGATVHDRAGYVTAALDTIGIGFKL